MRFIHPLSHETLRLLNRVHKQSRHHRVRQRAHCIVLSSQGYTTTHLADIFQGILSFFCDQAVLAQILPI
ncbi:hypothetical protein C2W62_10485 [Candidatus Entotheonella serta]|nr:hypothetical protein C2W62_10485 [Candidatus Entotheonella serta]